MYQYMNNLVIIKYIYQIQPKYSILLYNNWLFVSLSLFTEFQCLHAVSPLFVRMQGLNQPLVSGVRTRVTCSSAGARPQPQIVWNKGGAGIRGASQTVSAQIYLSTPICIMFCDVLSTNSVRIQR